jgi:hypothetical protein
LEAIEFCARVSRLTGKNYRLSSEAEWEYACRAGTTTSFNFGQSNLIEKWAFNPKIISFYLINPSKLKKIGSLEYCGKMVE